MLKQRIVTALVLVAALVSAVAFLSIPWLAVVFALVVGIAAWEWSRLAGYESVWVRLLVVLVHWVVLAALYLQSDLGSNPAVEQVQPVFGVAGLWWAIALLWVKGYPASAGLWGNRPMLSLMGMLVLVPAWLAVIYLLSYDNGGLLLLFMIIVVAAADIGAYFAGRRFGRRKLAPDVSPGKSWEGVWGGLLACTLLAVLTWWWLRPEQLGFAGILAVVLSTALVSVLGDLVESMVKRHRGVKDSGVLLPGHGGFLDRLDGYTAAAPVFALGLILAGW